MLNVILDFSNELYLSPVRVWELAIKVKTGKLTLPIPLIPFVKHEMQMATIEMLPLSLQHIEPITTLLLHHRDPFDRLLIAQSLTENIPIISADAAFDAYAGITRIW